MIARLRGLIFNNLSIKAASLIIAVLMWFGVARDPVAEIAIRVPVEFQHPPQNLDYSSDVIPQAMVRLRGPARLLRDLPQESVHATVNLQGAVPGEHTYDLEQIQVPHEVEVMQVTPARIHMMFDQRASKQVPVRPRVVGTLPPGYRIESVTATPATVTITGPAHRVNAIDAALTDTIDASGVAGQANFDTMVYLPDPLVHLSGSGSIRVAVRTQQASSKAGVP